MFYYKDDYLTMICKDYSETNPSALAEGRVTIVKVICNKSVKFYEPGQTVFIYKDKLIEIEEPNELLKDLV